MAEKSILTMSEDELSELDLTKLTAAELVEYGVRASWSKEELERALQLRQMLLSIDRQNNTLLRIQQTLKEVEEGPLYSAHKKKRRPTSADWQNGPQSRRMAWPTSSVVFLVRFFVSRRADTGPEGFAGFDRAQARSGNDGGRWRQRCARTGSGRCGRRDGRALSPSGCGLKLIASLSPGLVLGWELTSTAMSRTDGCPRPVGAGQRDML